MADNISFVGKFHALYKLINIKILEFQATRFLLAITYQKLLNSSRVHLGIRLLDYYIWQVRLLYMAILYFPFLGLYSLAYIRPHLVQVILSF